VVRSEWEELLKIRDALALPYPYADVVEGVEVEYEEKWMFSPERLEVITKDMEAYLKEVEAESERLNSIIPGTIKNMVSTLKPKREFNGMRIIQVGSLDLGTQYSVDKDDHCLDLVLFHPAYKDTKQLQ
jgi:hypothetical protein